MSFYESPAWEGMIATLVGLTFVCLAAGFVRVFCALGTRGRYLSASIQHLTMYPAIVGMLLQAAEAVARRNFIDLGIFLATTGIWVWQIITFRRDDDDDWFTGAGARLRRWRPRGWTRPRLRTTERG